MTKTCFCGLRGLLTAVFLCIVSGLLAQQGTIKGTVTDSSGAVLSNATVSVGSTHRKTLTDAKGQFTIRASPGEVITVSHAGFDTRSVTLGAGDNLTIPLAVNFGTQDQVVVLGYNTQEKHKLTSAVATISAEELTQRVATDPTSLLQGQLPGLSVVQNSAEPGNEGMQLLIRGMGTFSGAGTNPFIIVDGLPGSLSAINPNDIESVTLLKDAASAAIYGSRGANGVLVVKTKKGKGGHFALTFNYNIGFATATRLPDLVTNSAQYMEMADSAYVHSGLAPLYSQAQIDLYRNATDRNRYPNNNWLKDVFRTATVQNYYLNMTGGQSGTTYSLGLGYTGQPGTMIGFTYHKYTLDLGLTSAVSKRITFGTNIQARYGDYIAPEDGSGDFYLSTLAQSPLYKPRFDNGSWIASAYSNESHNKNPVAIANNSTTLQPDYYAQGNLSLDILLLDGLKWENKAGLTFETQKYNTFAPSVPVYYYSDSSYAGTLDDGTPGLYVGRSDNIYTTFYSQLNYKRTFGPHTLSVLGGFQQEHNVASNIDAFRTQFATNALRELNAGPTTGQTNDGTSSQWAIQSFYGNLNYDYDDRFLLGASTRYDGTSRLPASSRWGLFYSFSGGWRISREAFLKDVRWLDDLKLRASWGELGNQNIGTYPYQALLSQSSYAFAGNVATGFAATSLTDPSLTWETTRVFDGGVDLTVWNNRLNITGDWYNKYTFDILRGSQVPVWLGLNAPTVNNGAVRNTGWELSAQYKDNVGKSFQYHLGVKLQHNRNRLVSFGTPEINGNTIMKNGQPINSYYLYVVDGVFQNQAEISKSAVQNPAPAPGDLKYADINGDGVIDGNDRKVVSGVYPDLEYSFNAGASWKGFDLNLQLYGSHGAKLYMSGWGAEPFLQGSMPTKDWLDAWTPAHPSATMPRLYVGWSYPQVDNYNSTFFLHNASFLRVKNVVVGYTLPARLSKGFHSLRIYFSGDNLLLFSPIKGVDPERAGGNTLFVNYPQNRTLTVGASVQF